MPLPRPTLTGLRQQARAFLMARMPGADAALRRAVLRVVADVNAGFVNLEFGYLDWIVENLLPDSANEEYLARWCGIFDIARNSAALAAGNAVFAGTNGVTIGAGTVLQTSNGGIQFQTTAAVTIAGGTATVAIEALVGGSDGNQDVGTPLTLVNAVAGVNATATVATGGLNGGDDQESLANWRGRLLDRIRQPPQGGAAYDYRTWAKTVPGVTRVWVFPLNRGRGTVDVTFVMDGRTNIIPTPTDVANVQAAIDAKRPVTADCIVFAPTAAPIDLTIQNLTPNTPATQAAVAANVKALYLRAGDPGGTIAYADIDDAIGEAQDVTYHFLAVPSADVTLTFGHVPVPGITTYS